MNIESQISLSDSARQVLQRSSVIAAENGHQDVYSDHLLEALLEDRGIRGILRFYKEDAISIIKGFKYLRLSMGNMAQPVPPRIPISFTDASRDILATSIRIARELKVAVNITPLILMRGVLLSVHSTNTARYILETALGLDITSKLSKASMGLEIGMKLVETLDDPTVPQILKQRILAHIDSFIETILQDAKRQEDSLSDKSNMAADPRRF